ncbi:MAG TPA: site-2 protease family protein [Candidatus Saccharimonadales bacterium]|nr:site-2 protease family protein [Candidatus Saccharimonadales bacterium]
MRRWSIPVLDIFGIHFRVHFSFPLMFCLVWILETGHGPQVGLRCFILMLLVMFAVITHEVGHAVVAARNGIRVRSVVLLPIAGISLLDEQAQRGLDARREIRISLAGPILNLVFAALIAATALILHPHVRLFRFPWLTPFDLVRSFFWAQLFIAVLNLLPAYPLDGGRILRAVLATNGDHVNATRRAVSIGQFFSLALFLCGGAVFLGSSSNNLWIMMAGAFLFLAAQLEDRSMILQAVLERVRVRDVMVTDFITLSPAETLADALQRSVDPPQEEFPVVRGTDMVGVISRQQMAESIEEQGNGYVQSAMRREYPVAGPQESLAAVLRRIGHSGLSMIPVVDSDYLVGIITFQNLMRKLTALSLRRSATKASPSNATAQQQ